MDGCPASRIAGCMQVYGRIVRVHPIEPTPITPRILNAYTRTYTLYACLTVQPRGGPLGPRVRRVVR